mmetsp:Transcript_21887/g.36625  ORF Transcript_21887/g.36625 Transcript_21887/m.36625 type:complete len:754 (+) Transcript_21887:62-2323(+)
MAMDNSAEVINDLILELSLLSSLPIAAAGRDLMRATAAANSLACRTKEMELKELRTFEWTIQPLLDILVIDVEKPVAAKAALGLRTLMGSRICMARLVDVNGLIVVSRVLDILLAKRVNDMKTPCTARSVVEHLVVVYREVARFYQWKIVDIGGIRHCVILLRFGDVVLQTITSTTLASLSADLEICKQMFSYGAIKPLINVSDGEKTNEACMLAGLGCCVQLCRIPEIGVRMVGQGVVPLIEKGIMTFTRHGNQAIREKSLYALGYLSKIPEVRRKLTTPITVEGIYNEFSKGTIASKETILQMLMNLHSNFSDAVNEKEFVHRLRDHVLELLRSGPWNSRNLCIKAICVLYRTDDDRWYMTDNGLIEMIFAAMADKSSDLHEAPVVCLIHLCTHPDIPFLLLKKGCAKVAAALLYADDPIIRELSVIVLKSLLLYNSSEVERVTPKDRQYLLKRDVYNPQLFGEEYGGLIQEYLQTIVENRHDQDYLINMFTKEEVKKYHLNHEELDQHQLTFAELDVECRGWLGIDELRLLMVVMGEKFDRDEIQDLLDEFDLDKSGNLDFREFVLMMKNWNTRFGTGWRKFFNESTKRGAIGKSRRTWSLWWNQDKRQAAQVKEQREKHKSKKTEGQTLQLAFLSTAQMEQRREKEKELRELGLSVSPNYKHLPPIDNGSSRAVSSSRGATGFSSINSSSSRGGAGAFSSTGGSDFGGGRNSGDFAASRGSGRFSGSDFGARGSGRFSGSDLGGKVQRF